MADGDGIDGNDLLGPEVAELLAAFPVFTASDGTIAEMRTIMAAFAVPPAEGIDVRDHPVPGTEVVVRVYRPVAPAATGPLPGVFSIHGGGFVLGNRLLEDERFMRWCPMGCVGFSVEYRLAPESPYPGPLEDCYAGLAWVHEHHEELGVDPGRIGVAGVSAGGGLSAGLTLLSRARGGPSIAFQLLECPMLDDRPTGSNRLDNLAIWNRGSNEYGWRSYLGDLHGGDDVPETAAPARAQDLSGLPPAFVSVGGADGFRDEDIEYAARLARAGVPTELHVYPGLPHGISMLGATPATSRWNRDVDDWLARRLSAPGA